jgi:phospholipid:diacylglycerol acyltransferase
MRNLRSVIDEQLSDLGVNFTSLDLPSFSMPTELVQLSNDLFSAPRKWTEQLDFSVGQRLRNDGLASDYPVILLPGIVSTGLESWSTEAGVFRKRLWGSVSMVRTIATQKDMWIKHLSLDPHTGLDPHGIKVRAAEGLDAASYFVSGYWIWARIIENLAAIGYDTNDLWLASYDWRLSFHNLEVRDKFFSRLKLHFEQNLALTGKKSVLVAHSMGSSVALHFMKWVEASGPDFGNGGADWVDKHIESFVSIAGTFLGVPKAMAALLSGEMRDTVELPPAAAYLLERFFSRRERAKLFRTWAGSASMLIKGGNAVWGNETWAPDDEPDTPDGLSHGKLYSFKLPGDAGAEEHPQSAAKSAYNDVHQSYDQDHVHNMRSQMNIPRNLSAHDAYTWLLQHTPSTFQRMVEQNYSNGIEYDEEQVKRNNQIEKTWANPLEAALPNAPNLKIHCIYGVGKPTERSYWYVQGPYERDEFIAEGDAATCLDCGNKTSSTPLEFPTGRTGWIDTSVHDDKATPQIRSGVKFSDGDGTVSTHSLGAMCIEGWKRKRYNPANIKVFTHEIAHEPEPLDLRGGKTTGDHVDILGSFAVNEIVLRVAAGMGNTVNESFFSQERQWAKNVAWDSPLSKNK